MFSANLARLSSYSKFGLRVVRDCEFFSVGKIPTKLDKRLVPVGSAKYTRELISNLQGVAGAICREDVADEIPEHIGCAVCDDPMSVFYKIHAERTREGVYWNSFRSRVDPTAKIHPSAYISETDVVIGPGSIIDAGARRSGAKYYW